MYFHGDELRIFPDLTRRLVPFAIELRLFGGKIKRAERYLQLVTQTLPGLNINDLEKTELLAFAHEHLGGVLLHQSLSRQAVDAYHKGDLLFCRLARDSTDTYFKGFWKHRTLACALGEASALRLSGNLEVSTNQLTLLLTEARGLDQKADRSSRTFEYRGHRFRTFIAEVQRSRGTVLAAAGNARESLAAFRESVDILETEGVAEHDPNQLVATYLKRAAVHTKPDVALAELETARDLADRRKEVGVYKVFLDKAFARTYRWIGETNQATEYAQRGLRSANRLGLHRQVWQLEALLGE